MEAYQINDLAILRENHTYLLLLKKWKKHIKYPRGNVKLLATLVKQTENRTIGHWKGTIYEFDCVAIQHNNNTTGVNGYAYNALKTFSHDLDKKYEKTFPDGISKFGYDFGRERLFCMNGTIQTMQTHLECNLYECSLGSVGKIVSAKRSQSLELMMDK